jgi:uncharacterized protein Yka (UPF0111/DUF47 family)
VLRFLRKEAPVFDLFDDMAARVVSAAEHLRKFALGFPRAQSELQFIHDAEAAADEIGHGVLERLKQSFMIPIDREDAHALAGGLDDVIDHIDSLAKRFPLYHVEAMDPTFVLQTEVLVRAAGGVGDAVRKLRTSHRLSDLGDTLVAIHRQESIGDDNHHAALSRLFDGGCPPLFALKWKELHTLVEEAIDACEDVGNILERIVLKNA